MNKNIAVVGCGYWGKNLVRNFHDLEALHTICDASPKTLETISKEYKSVKVTGRYDDVLADKTVKAVAISSPAATHYDLAKKAILAGKDVFVEKPLALRTSEGAELVKLSAEKNRILMVGHILHYHPAVAALKNIVSRGTLGRIRYIYSNRLSFGKIRREENILWSFAPHDISMILGLLSEEPVEVSAKGSNYLHPSIADVTMSQMKFESGINAHIFVSWLHPFKEQKLIVVGDDLMAVFDDTAPWESKLVLYPHEIVWTNGIPEAKKADGKPVPLEKDEPLKAECRHFVDCIEKRSKPLTDGNEGVRGLRVLNALQESLDKNGITVALSMESQRDVILSEAKDPGKYRDSSAAPQNDNSLITDNQSPITNHQSQKNFFVHETAIVDEGAKIGKGTKVWHFAHVMPGAEIGENCSLGQNVVVMPGTRLGRNVKVQNNVSVYEKVICEDDVFLGPSMVFTNVFNPRSHISRKHEYKDTYVRKGATVGANATIVCGNEIGEYAFVGSGAVVTKNISAYALVYGNPARQHGWMCQCGVKLSLGMDDRIEEATCSACGTSYVRRRNEVKLK